MPALQNCALALFLLLVSPLRNDAQDNWVGTWAAAPQAGIPGQVQTFHNQTVRLIVHTSVAGKKVRIKISNAFSDKPLLIDAVHIARRASGADIDPASDRALRFHGHTSTTIPPRSLVGSDPVNLEVPALSDLAISLFFAETATVTTSHILAKQTNYVSSETGDATAQTKFPVAKTITSWPFLTGVDVAASPRGAAIVTLGSSLTDGDGSTRDTNRRWPDVLAELLQKAGGADAELGVLNEGIIGNRLLSDTQSARQAGGPPPLGAVFGELGPALGQSGVARFDRDVLSQAGVKYVILALGVNDILFPGSFIPKTETVTANDLIAGNRQLIARTHKKGLRVIGTTIPPFEHALFRDPFYDRFYSLENEKIRQETNAWIRAGGEFDGVIDFDEAIRDPDHPTQILPAFDSGDHLHVNNSGNVAQGNAIPLSLFHNREAFRIEPHTRSAILRSR
jgi:lysophospholipase L1-like esterase